MIKKSEITGNKGKNFKKFVYEIQLILTNFFGYFIRLSGYFYVIAVNVVFDFTGNVYKVINCLQRFKN